MKPYPSIYRLQVGKNSNFPLLDICRFPFGSVPPGAYEVFDRYPGHVQDHYGTRLQSRTRGMMTTTRDVNSFRSMVDYCIDPGGSR